ncbi:FAD-dependent monooxygenase [Amycolatopsis saalfeldensis]|uniref:2-polyprenyl-6-methoxyphenol hydroxylase n=1 Tax=Amycolatopsis saalfeldensis TaxID=394193 RepID=A0A1H8YNI1_9PSEU|nr:FAD-dependent monooxygenase [Amycolatopsis saalfeldensis]SEP53561.1 2-polyprenyl-6-methoxyphenol hydroxylase [Amycolatopsis saalfeldensis]
MTSVPKRAVIVGAGIAGLATALRLRQIGWEPLVLERAPHPRGAGYVLNFFGLGYEAAERMGVLPGLRQRHTGVPRLDYVKPDGRRHFSVARSTLESILDERNLTLLRGDIETVLYDEVRREVEIRFGTTIDSITKDGTGVRVGLSDGATEHADLLIGADGVHSKVRQLVFGPEHRFRRDLNHIVAAIPLETMPAGTRSGTTTTLTSTGRTLAITNLGPDRTAAFFTYGTRDPDAELAKGPRAVVDRFGDLGWAVPDLLDLVTTSDSLYFDSVCQVVTDRWSDGRVVLIGDAAWCVSLFGGYGASLAVGGADLLATELDRAGDDITAALDTWEAKLRPDIERLQKMGRRNTAAHAPGSRFHVFARNLVMRMVSFPPVRHLVRRHFQLDGRH